MLKVTCANKKRIFLEQSEASSDNIFNDDHSLCGSFESSELVCHRTDSKIPNLYRLIELRSDTNTGNMLFITYNDPQTCIDFALIFLLYGG